MSSSSEVVASEVASESGLKACETMEDDGTGAAADAGFRGLSIAIDTGHKSSSYYANGVYYKPKCKNNLDGLDQAVVVVGYGKLKGEDYWLIKNSWSNYWGNDRYALMAVKANNCGLTTDAMYVNSK
ncbi:digestive cysteine proteinase 1-like [Ochlerotatus camptorhynchus]|uniref:digestive cysteine proteinase 1-like n=1 Tax=Ochlerotatus camptorhynchus TaxID=644619 RepID=UPI0031D36131